MSELSVVGFGLGPRSVDLGVVTLTRAGFGCSTGANSFVSMVSDCFGASSIRGLKVVGGLTLLGRNAERVGRVPRGRVASSRGRASVVAGLLLSVGSRCGSLRSGCGFRSVVGVFRSVSFRSEVVRVLRAELGGRGTRLVFSDFSRLVGARASGSALWGGCYDRGGMVRGFCYVGGDWGLYFSCKSGLSGGLEGGKTRGKTRCFRFSGFWFPVKFSECLWPVGFR